jgi:hypothetical protein
MIAETRTIPETAGVKPVMFEIAKKPKIANV